METADPENFSASPGSVSPEQMQVGWNPLAYGTTSVSVDVKGVPNTVPGYCRIYPIAQPLKRNLTQSVIFVERQVDCQLRGQGLCPDGYDHRNGRRNFGLTSTSLQVEAPGVSSIRFMSASPETIVLEGNGLQPIFRGFCRCFCCRQQRCADPERA